jgi:DNA-binding GntR family transcriptional regulator
LSQIEEGQQSPRRVRRAAPGAPPPCAIQRELSVNPATVAKAYQRLAEAGVLAVRRGDGTYVAESPPSIPRESATRNCARALQVREPAATLGACF